MFHMYVLMVMKRPEEILLKKIAIKILEFLVPGKSFKFIKLPENHDPDSFFKNGIKKILKN